jgi:hypothetical protein
MCNELFDGNIINGPDLAEAINRSIIKRPNYITAAYDTEERLIKNSIKIINCLKVPYLIGVDILLLKK